MKTDPAPHSVRFEEDEFNEVISYLHSKPEIEGFRIDHPPSEIPEATIEKMEQIGFLEYRNLGQFKVFFCGYGEVGKGWGFVYGEFSQNEIEHPQQIRTYNHKIEITYLEHIKGKWFRFGAE